jgi:hypothetical protein
MTVCRAVVTVLPVRRGIVGELLAIAGTRRRRRTAEAGESQPLNAPPHPGAA